MIKIRDLTFGDRIFVQSMISKKIHLVDEILQEIKDMKNEGLDIIRLAFEKKEDAPFFKEICSQSPVPVVADIHFDYNLAVLAMENGADKIRINPGNMKKEHLKYLVDALKLHHIPVRVGSNLGSLEKSSEALHGRSAKALALSCIENVKLLEDLGFSQIVMAVKASDVKTTIEANKILRACLKYPIHLGVTESGTKDLGSVKSHIGIGALLACGIGDTIRVSLSAPPLEEVREGVKILKALDLVPFVKVISCPTCGRCNYDVEKLAKAVEKTVEGVKKPYTIAVMGCVVNGIGEGRDASLGIFCGKDKFVVMREGETLKNIEGDPTEEFLKIVKEEISKL